MSRWRIGDVTVTKVVELEVTGGSRFILPQATREAIQPIAWLRPHFADEDGRLLRATLENPLILSMGFAGLRSVPQASPQGGKTVRDRSPAPPVGQEFRSARHH